MECGRHSPAIPEVMTVNHDPVDHNSIFANGSCYRVDELMLILNSNTST